MKKRVNYWKVSTVVLIVLVVLLIGLKMGNDDRNILLSPGGVSHGWSEITGKPSIVSSESDPTVAASVKDGISWGEISGRPAGLDDGDQLGTPTISGETGCGGDYDGNVCGIPGTWDVCFLTKSVTHNGDHHAKGCMIQGSGSSWSIWAMDKVGGIPECRARCLKW